MWTQENRRKHQQVRTSLKRGDPAYDANKKVSGRKRHIAVDTDGRLLAMNLTPGDIADSTGAQMVFDDLITRWAWDRCCCIG